MIYFIRDALFFLEFEAAVSYADLGRVLRIMKYWALMFRGAGQHNYARECVELLVRFKYETLPMLLKTLERILFDNRKGIRGRATATDFFLEQLNYWVKVVNIPHGAGVTAEYIIKKGSACAEAFRDISHKVANVFDNPDSRRHKEVKFMEDIQVLVEDLELNKIHYEPTIEHFVPAKAKKGSVNTPVSRIVDIQFFYIVNAPLPHWPSDFTDFIAASLELINGFRCFAHLGDFGIFRATGDHQERNCGFMYVHVASAKPLLTLIRPHLGSGRHTVAFHLTAFDEFPHLGVGQEERGVTSSVVGVQTLFHQHPFGIHQNSFARTKSFGDGTAIQEDVLKEWVKVVARRGFPLALATIGDYASEIAGAPVGETWPRRFKERNPDLKVKWASSLEECRARALNPAVVSEYFALLHETIERYDIKDQEHL
ncbi:hypothetical protein MSAN_02325500 [Mycena sanguinolenta]|uniref:HTH CENPB-type domain-containing protein n=1 Tax=Mycena sanguinolenta TaxID=230812 RepID=A0A8H6X8B0_9AGAR|nr:hypothetical protein MSAN_02325500 [Mycena sanguinolenta]